MEYLLISFIAGMLTILSPCVLPILPIILGGSTIDESKWRPFVITLSLGVSIIIFTLLLKTTTLFVDIPQDFWKYFSAGIIGLYGLSLIFPGVWSKVSEKLGLEGSSHKMLSKAKSKKGIWGGVFIGMSLGPVFASCSPVYLLIVATVIPQSFFVGLINLLLYVLGLFIVMFIIASLGQKFIAKLKWAMNPKGFFRKFLGVIFILVALLIGSGADKELQIQILDKGFIDITKVEQKLLEETIKDTKKQTIPAQNTVKNDNMAQDMQQETIKLESTGIEAIEKPIVVADNNIGEESDLIENLFSSLINEIEDERDIKQEGFHFPYNYKAPELLGLTNWINSEPIESLDELKGKVVLIDFWTYSCINCIRTLPHLNKLQEKYKDKGLVILGIHAPEFSFEKKLENVKKEVIKRGIKYPVVQDNDFATWKNYDNHYWPAEYLIDKKGYVRYTHFGEGAYQETEDAIKELLSQ